MPRIPDSEIARLKGEISLARLVTASGVKLKRKGDDLHGRCPFHDDHTPSLVVSPRDNLWHCLGACQTGGSVIDWVMKQERCSFREAAERLRNEHPSLLAEAPSAPARAARKGAEESLDDAARMRWVSDFYHKTLKRSPEALEYLEARGIADPEAIETFQLGYANRTLAYELPHGRRKDGKAIRSHLQQLGILRKSGHEHLNGSIVIPLYGGADGSELVQMYGRKVRDDLRKGTPSHLYLPGPKRGLFNARALREERHIILCESILDALSFWCAGMRNVTACYGASGLAPALREALCAPHIERVTLAFDRDEAGEKGAAKIAAELVTAGKSVFAVRFPRGMDANAYALKVQPAAQSLALAVKGAEWLGGAGGGASAARTKAASEAPEALSPTTVAPASSPLAAVTPVTAEQEQLREKAASQGADQACEADSAEASGVDGAEADEVRYEYGDRTWRVRGLSRNERTDSLKVNLFVSRSVSARDGGGFHVDTVELYNARHRSGFVKQAVEELGCEERIVKRDLGRVLLALEQRQEAARAAQAAPKTRTPKLSNTEKAEAMALLKDPKLMDRILVDMNACGIVGERINKLIGYLAAVSRKLDRPLAVVIQSSSAAGKSSLMDAILSLVPEEDRVQYSAMTGQSLFYMGEQDLKHRILAIVEEEGAERASYALKLLQSEGELTIASTGKDPQSGRHVTQEYHVEGPVMIMLTTTAIDIDEELLNRCLVLSVDEGAEQTARIHAAQRNAETLNGQLARKAHDAARSLHQNAQRLLRPLMVVNPFANDLDFATHRTRLRRDHAKYLTLIRTIALLHQHQRPHRSVEHRGQRLDYIEVSRSDIALADKLFADTLRRTLDELPPQTRKLLGEIEAMAREQAEAQGVELLEVRFTRREVREWAGIGETQTRLHLERLEQMEYLHVAEQGRGRRRFYTLAIDHYDPTSRG